MNRAIIYLITEFFSKLLIFLLFPFVAKILTIEDFGVFSLIFPAMQYFQIVFIFGLTVPVSALFFDKQINRNELLFNAVVYWVFWMFIVYFIYQIFLFDFFQNIAYNIISKYMLVYLGSAALLMLLTQYYQLTKNALAFSFFYLTPKLIMFLIIFYFSYFKKHLELEDLIYKYTIVELCFGVIALLFILHKSIFKINKNLYREFLTIGAPIVISGIVGYLLVVSGRAIVANVSSLSEVAIFSIIQSVAQIITLFYAVISRTVGIENFKRVANKNLTEEYLNSVFKISSIILALSILIIACMSYPILLFINQEKYIQYTPFIIFLLFGYYFQIYYNILVDIIYAKKKTIYVNIITILIIVLNIILVYLLFPLAGIFGAVLAQVITIMVQSLAIVYLVGQYDIKISLYPLKSNLLILSVGLVLIIEIGRNMPFLILLSILFFIGILAILYTNLDIIKKLI